MNITDGTQCETCSTSNGFSSAERRSIIIMVLLTSITLVACYVSVLWFAIRTRFIPAKDSNVIVHNNDAFDNHENDSYEDYVQPIDNTRRTTTTTSLTPQVKFSIKNELIAK